MLRLNSFKSKIIISFSLLIFVLMAITIFFIYSVTSNIIEELTLVYVREAFTKVLGNVDYILREANKLAANLLVDDEIIDLFSKDYVQGSYEDISRRSNLERKLRKVYINSYDFKTEISLINEERKIFLSTYQELYWENVFTSEWYGEIKYKLEKGMDKNVVFVPTHKIYNRNSMSNFLYTYDGISDVVTLIMKYNTLRDLKNSLGYIIIDINYDDIKKAIGNTNSKNLIYIVSEKDGPVYDNNNQIELGKLLGKEDYDKIFSDNTGTFYTSDSRNSAIVLFDTSKVSGWKIVNIIPLSSLMDKVSSTQKFMITLGLIGILISIMIAAAASNRMTKPLTEMRRTMARVEQGELELRFRTNNTDEVGLLADGFNSMLDEINHLIESVIEKEKEKREARLYSLQSQINPHFLYNTLNSIRYLADNYNAQDIKEMVTAFINLLRVSISNPNEFVSVRDEIENAKSYVKIQQLRYGSSFHVVYDIDESVLMYSIPKLIIQPLIENAIFHGIEPKGRSGTILIVMKENMNILHISVIDDGVGMNERRYKKDRDGKDGGKSASIGIRNINERIKIYFGDEYGLHIFSLIGCGTKVEVTLPAKKFKERK